MAFRAFEVALEIPGKVRPLLPRIKAGHADLADQVVRATNSIALNLLEGMGRSGRDRAYHCRIALGSAKEVFAGIKLAVGWGWLGEADTEEALAKIDEACGLLYGLSRK